MEETYELLSSSFLLFLDAYVLVVLFEWEFYDLTSFNRIINILFLLHLLFFVYFFLFIQQYFIEHRAILYFHFYLLPLLVFFEYLQGNTILKFSILGFIDVRKLRHFILDLGSISLEIFRKMHYSFITFIHIVEQGMPKGLFRSKPLIWIIRKKF